MNRGDVLAAALMAPPHPRYGILSYGRFERIQKLTKLADPEDSRFHTGIAWFVCTHEHDDPRLLTVLGMEDPLSAIRHCFENGMRFIELSEFIDWFNSEMNATEAASTKPKEQGLPGKPEEAQEAAAPTS